MPRADQPLSSIPAPSGARGSERVHASPPGGVVSVAAPTWQRAPTGSMRVPGVVFASADLTGSTEVETLHQVRNAASLPGIVAASYATPDVHCGYCP
jgi:tRNA-splicing ligase RtcB (3'-phosphate/5'-hydroxy nucleic acid ligase)